MALTFESPSWAEWASVAFVMGTQALSGVAKDLTKMSSKSAVKLVAGGATEAEHQSNLFRWVAILTGSKNALKGVGFFVGAALLAWLGFDGALWVMAVAILAALVLSLTMLRVDIGKSGKPKPLPRLRSDSAAINRLSLARMFLFGSRDIWFVVALPIFLDEELGWSFYATGGFLAAWIIGYGIVQGSAPKLVALNADEVSAARTWALVLGLVAAVIATMLAADVARTVAVVGGLIVFGVVFAVNSSVHSYLILAYTNADDVAMDVGFYYSANAAGRLLGTLLSGVVYLAGGLTAALWTATAFIAITWLLSLRLHRVGDSALTS